MKREEQDKITESELKELLIKMHKGESLIVTLGKIMEAISGIRI